MKFNGFLLLAPLMLALLAHLPSAAQSEYVINAAGNAYITSGNSASIDERSNSICNWIDKETVISFYFRANECGKINELQLDCDWTTATKESYEKVCGVVKELLDAKRNEYDYLLIDAPPLGMVIDAAVMASVCDGAVLVLNAGRIKYRMAQDVRNQIQRSGCKILGVVLNQVGKKGASSYGGYYHSKYTDTYYGYHDSQKGKTTGTVSKSAAPQSQQARPAAPSAQPNGQTVRRVATGSGTAAQSTQIRRDKQ